MEITLHMLHSEDNVREEKIEKDKEDKVVSILLQLQEFHSV